MKDGCLKTHCLWTSGRKTPDVSISSWWKLKIELKETFSNKSFIMPAPYVNTISPVCLEFWLTSQSAGVWKKKPPSNIKSKQKPASHLCQCSCHNSFHIKLSAMFCFLFVLLIARALRWLKGWSEPCRPATNVSVTVKVPLKFSKLNVNCWFKLSFVSLESFYSLGSFYVILIKQAEQGLFL